MRFDSCPQHVFPANQYVADEKTESLHQPAGSRRIKRSEQIYGKPLRHYKNTTQQYEED